MAPEPSRDPCPLDDVLTPTTNTLNEVAEEFGGGNEIWRLQVPDACSTSTPASPGPSRCKPGERRKLVSAARRNIHASLEAALALDGNPGSKKRLDAGEPRSNSPSASTTTWASPTNWPPIEASPRPIALPSTAIGRRIQRTRIRVREVAAQLERPVRGMTVVRACPDVRRVCFPDRQMFTG